MISEGGDGDILGANLRLCLRDIEVEVVVKRIDCE